MLVNLYGNTFRRVAWWELCHFPRVHAHRPVLQRSHDIVGCVLVGGTEKLRGGEDYGVPLAATLEEAIAEFSPEVVLDLSDEP